MKIIRPVFVAQDGGFTRDSVGTYYDKNGRMQTAVANALRVTYDPSDLSAPPYALYEASLSQLLRYTEELNNSSSYGGAQFAIAANAATAPDGSTTADRLMANTTTAFHYLDQEVFGRSYVDGEKYTFSVFARADTISRIRLDMYYAIGGTGGFVAAFNLATGTIDGGDAYIESRGAKIQALPGGWFRCSIVGTVSQAAAYPSKLLCRVVLLDANGNGSYAGVNAPGAFMWGWNLTPGDKLSSYIASGATPLTRAADTIGTHGLQYSSIPENDYPAWDAATVYSKGDRILDLPNHKVYESLIGAKGNVVLPVASPCRASMTIDGVPYVPAVNASFKVTTAGVLPSNVTANTTYYVKDITGDTFAFSATIGGSAISTTGATTGVHSLVIQDNLGKSIYNKSFWIDAGASNRFTPFDTYVQSQAKATSEITFVVSAATYVDTVSLLNMKASSVSVSVTHVNDGLVFSKTEVLTSNDGAIDNWYDYFLAGFNAKREAIIEGIPRYGNTLITVCLKGVTGQEVAIGAAIFGLSKDISVSRTGAEHGAKVGIQAFDTKKRDDFGNYTIVPRAFAKRADFTVYISNDELDGIMDLLTDIRSVPTLFLGSNKYNAAMIYGYFKSFDIDIAYPKYSICSIQLDGLT